MKGIQDSLFITTFTTIPKIGKEKRHIPSSSWPNEIEIKQNKAKQTKSERCILIHENSSNNVMKVVLFSGFLKWNFVQKLKCACI